MSNIFKDLGFKNRGGVLSAPSTELLNGRTMEELETYFGINIGSIGLSPDLDGSVIIAGNFLPYTIEQEINQPDFFSHTVTAKNLSENGNIIVNGTILDISKTYTIGTDVYTEYNTVEDITNTYNISIDGTADEVRVDLMTLILPAREALVLEPLLPNEDIVISNADLSSTTDIEFRETQEIWLDKYSEWIAE